MRQVSPFAHLARVPAEQPNWGAAAVMTGIGVLLGLAGVVAYRHRDLRG